MRVVFSFLSTRLKELSLRKRSTPYQTPNFSRIHSSTSSFLACNLFPSTAQFVCDVHATLKCVSFSLKNIRPLDISFPQV